MDDKIEAWRHGLLRLVLQHARAYADNSDPAKTEAAYVAICDYLRTTPEGYRMAPVEPTEAMIAAAAAKWQQRIRGRVESGSIFSPTPNAQRLALTENYTAMLAASQESGT